MKKRFEVLWSRESKKQFDSIVTYLREKFTEREVAKFIQKLRSFELIVSEYPEVYAEAKSGFRRAVLSKHNSVIYRINNSKSVIRVYTIFDNRQQPGKLT